MKRRLVNSLLSTAACGCLALPALAQDPPNLIFILTDDMGIDAIDWPPGTAPPAIKTPNLHAMAEQGVSFTNCRVNPNCSPTRACLMTGRSALDSGVVGVIGRYIPLAEDGNPCESNPLVDQYAQVTNRLAMQTQERTIAEVLQDMGYYTILIDKWHLGYNEDSEYNADERRLQRGNEQGFDVFVDWMDDICDGYGSQDPYYYADFHMLRAMEAARDAVNDRPGTPKPPYALFFHTITPHKRMADEGGKSWWDIYDQDLVPQTHGYPHTNEGRFARNVEALDTALLLELLGPGTENLRVLDSDAQYDDQANTIIFFIGDNGTDASLTDNRGKNTLYEGGVRVPLFVMGEGVPQGTPNEPIIDNRQISHVDIYDTICDIVGATTERDNPNGAFPRRGESFAYNIGYSEEQGARDITVCSLGVADTGVQTWKVAIVYRPPGEQDDCWKLVCSSGGAGLDDMTGDEFYDLKNDPGEAANLVQLGMTYEELVVYYGLRDRLSDEWPTAVSVAAEPEIIPTYWAEHRSGDYVLVVYVVNYNLQGSGYDEFFNVDVDPDRDHDLLIEGMTQGEAMLYALMRNQVEAMWYANQRITPDPDVRVVDTVLEATLVLASPTAPFEIVPLTVGHEDAGGGGEREFRALLRFDVDDIEFPDGFGFGDVVDAQLIINFNHDSTLCDPNDHEGDDYIDFMESDADTGVITAYKMLGPWTSSPWDNFNDETPLGQFDPPPHIIGIPFMTGDDAKKIRVTPMPSGTPVSFGHSGGLLSAVNDWRSGDNYGLILVAEELPYFLNEQETDFRDQQVHFFRDATIRLTLNRDPN